MALRFVTSRPFVTSNIIGATTLAQLKTDIEGGLLKLPDAVLKDIEETHLIYPNPCP
jgi:aryl-alcohol dehydrogenase-like predicted oxidoreductase